MKSFLPILIALFNEHWSQNLNYRYIIRAVKNSKYQLEEGGHLPSSSFIFSFSLIL
jgi:hypothetical protein